MVFPRDTISEAAVSSLPITSAEGKDENFTSVLTDSWEAYNGRQDVEAQTLELVTAVLVGIGLSAACGFRVFVPLLGASIAAHSGYLQLSPEFSWLGSTPALLAFALATILEFGAYSVPFLDHLMDAVATPAAVIAGTLLMASLLGEASPFLRWSLAIIAGGGAAGLVQAGSVMARGSTAVMTGGFGNLVVALLEFAGAAVMTLLALLVPVLAVIGLVIGLLMVRALVRRSRTKNNLSKPLPPPA